MYPSEYLHALLGAPLTPEDEPDAGGGMIGAALRAGTPAARLLTGPTQMASEMTPGDDSLVFMWRESVPAAARWHSGFGCRLDVVASPRASYLTAMRILALLNRDEAALGILTRRPTLRNPGWRPRARQGVYGVDWGVLLRDDDRNLPPPDDAPTVMRIIFLPLNAVEEDGRRGL